MERLVKNRWNLVVRTRNGQKIYLWLFPYYNTKGQLKYHERKVSEADQLKLFKENHQKRLKSAERERDEWEEKRNGPQHDPVADMNSLIAEGRVKELKEQKEWLPITTEEMEQLNATHAADWEVQAETKETDLINNAIHGITVNYWENQAKGNEIADLNRQQEHKIDSLKKISSKKHEERVGVEQQHQQIEETLQEIQNIQKKIPS